MGPINIYQIYADTCQPAISNQAHEMARHGGPQLLGSAVAAHGEISILVLFGVQALPLPPAKSHHGIGSSTCI